MKSFSLLQILRVGVLVYEWLDIPILKHYYDFGFDHYNLGWHKAGIRGLIDTLLNNSGPFAHGNWVLPDLSIQSALQLNKKLKTFDKTFYFRCVIRKHFTLFSVLAYYCSEAFLHVCSLYCFPNHKGSRDIVEKIS